MYYADSNGAFLNDKKIVVNKLPVDKGLYTVEGPKHIIGEYKMNKFNRHNRHYSSAGVNFAFVAAGRLSGTNFICDTLWDYTPGIYIAKQAGAFIYDEKCMHIAANSEEFLKVMIENSGIGEEELNIVKK